MSHAKILIWNVLLIALFSSVWIVGAAGFEPTITMLGITDRATPGQQVEWLISLSNPSDEVGQNIVISDTIGTGLQVDHVQINTGTVSINDHNITVSIPILSPDETIQFSIFTTVVSTYNLSNTACITAANLSGEECVRGLPVQALPDTGEVPFWRQPFLWLAVMAISVSILLIGLGMLGMQALVQDD